VIYRACWSDGSDISFGSNALANLNISKQVVHLMESPLNPACNLWMHKYCSSCSVAHLLRNNRIPYKVGAIEVMMSGWSENSSKYIQKLMNVSTNIFGIFLENLKISDRFQNITFLMKAHKILIHARMHQTFNLDAWRFNISQSMVSSSYILKLLIFFSIQLSRHLSYTNAFKKFLAVGLL
jgi:hypothetical protein